LSQSIWQNDREIEVSQEAFVSIIVPTWNGLEYIGDCLASLLAQDYTDFEVFAVDNASTDGTPEWIAERFPAVRLIRNERNLGFAGAANVGLHAAKGSVLVLFNQDATAEAKWLRALVEGFSVSPGSGVAGCKILNMEDQTIQHAGGYLTMPRALPAQLSSGSIDTNEDGQPVDVEFVTGTAFAIRRELFEAIGGFDEDFFFYFEDVDYCYRARSAGFRVIYVPDAIVRHFGKASLGAGSVDYFARFHTSRLQFVMKHLGIPHFVSQLRPIEYTWLKSIISHEEQAGLRQAYQSILERVGSMGQDWSLDDDIQAELLSALRELREQVYAAYPGAALRSPDEVPYLRKSPPERWWEVQEYPFTSSVPILGTLIAWLRTLWNNVSTKWFVRVIRQQQNEVNRILVRRLEMQGQILRDLDRDQIRLTTQLAETLYRLDKIEAHLQVLEDKLEER
jgi:GT2 family glycosyltransferase